MKNIISYAIKNGEIDKNMLVTMVEQMDDDMAVRFTEAILGIAVQEEIPQVSKIYDKGDCRFCYYNYLKDLVEYEYDEEVTRYFKTQEEADNFTNGKSCRWDGDRRSSLECHYEGKRVFTSTDACSLAYWLEGAKRGAKRGV